MPSTVWNVESLRVTCFVDPAGSVPADGVWERLTTTAPLESSRRLKAGEVREAGEFLGGLLTYSAQPARIDWTLGASPGGEDPLSALGEGTKAIPPFASLMSRWLQSEDAPTLTRLAFGATLLAEVESRVAGYAHVLSLLPSVRLEPRQMSDFMYQNNRQRDVSVGPHQFRVNRLSKWSVAMFQTFQLQVGLFPGGAESTQLGPPRAASRLELDINTVPSQGRSIEREVRVELFERLVGFAMEIAQHGDID